MMGHRFRSIRGSKGPDQSGESQLLGHVEQDERSGDCQGGSQDMGTII